jgi:hypothetical protein
MKINGITTGMNFGLTKSPRYEGYENSLIKGIKNPQKKTEAQNVARAIGRRVPEGYLDINEQNTTFLLYTGDRETSIPQEISKVYPREPFKTIVRLNTKLKNL